MAAPGASRLIAYADLIADEVNVQQVKLLENVGALAETVLNVIPAAIGPRLGGRTPQVIAAARNGDWSRLDDGTVQVGGIEVLEGEFDLRLRPSDPVSQPDPSRRGRDRRPRSRDHPGARGRGNRPRPDPRGAAGQA